MPAPYNYNLNIPDPTNNIMQMMNFGQKIKQQRAVQAQQQAKQQAAMKREAEKNEYLAKVMDGPKAQRIGDLRKAVVKWNELSKPLKDVIAGMTAEKKRFNIGIAQQVHAAIESGNNQAGIDLLNDRAEYFEKGGLTQDAEALRKQAKLIETSPESAFNITSLLLASVLDDKEFANMLEKTRRMPSEIAKTEQETLKMEAETVGLERKSKNEQMLHKRFQSQATEPAKKEDAKANGFLAAHNKTIRSVIDLQKRIPALEGKVGGAWNTVSNKVLDYLTGITDPERRLVIGKLNEIRIRNALSMKVAGSMSDPEANMYLSTQLPENAKPAAITAYLGDIYKEANQDYAYNRLKTSFLRRNLDIGAANSTFTVIEGAPKIKKGEIFDDYIARIGNLSKYAPQRGAGSSPTPVKIVNESDLPPGARILKLNPATGKFE